MTDNPTSAAHPEYSAGALAWRDPSGNLHTRPGILVQCPTVDHEHTDQMRVNAHTESGPAGEPAWIVNVTGPNGSTVMEHAVACARALGSLLPEEK